MWWDKRIAALAAAAVLLFGGCAADTAGDGRDILTGTDVEKVRSYETYEVALSDIVKNDSVMLRPVYTQRQSLCAPEDGLFIEEIVAKYGERVPESGVIARFRRDSSEAELQKAELALKRAKEDWEEQQEDLEEALLNASYVGGAQYELAQLHYDRAEYLYQRQLKELQEAVDEQKEAFEPVELTAPYDCLVNSIEFLYAGQEVDRYTPIVTVDRVSSLTLVGSSVTSSFQYGSKVEITAKGGGGQRTATGRVVCTSALLGKEGQEVWIVPDVAVDPEELKNLVSGTAETKIVQVQDALTVPLGAIKMEGGNSYVQILVDGVTHKRYIIRGINVGSVGESRVVVLSGLELGQQVVVN